MRSRLGRWIAGAYVALAAAAFSVHLYSTYTNAGNSGESGILLIPFALPWLNWLPPGFFRSAIWENTFLAGWWLLVGVNALLIYAACGGIRWSGRHDG